MFEKTEITEIISVLGLRKPNYPKKPKYNGSTIDQ